MRVYRCEAYRLEGNRFSRSMTIADGVTSCHAGTNACVSTYKTTTSLAGTWDCYLSVTEL